MQSTDDLLKKYEPQIGNSISGMLTNVEVVIVNYGTFGLTRRAIWSLHSLYSSLPITVLDNDSPDSSLVKLRALQSEIQPLNVIACGRNLHHGPGLDHAIRHADTSWVLVFDSDCIAYRQGFLERMVEQAKDQSAYMVGELQHVNGQGYTVEGEVSHRYVHPKCALLRKTTYQSLPPFEKHGAPCLANAVAAIREGHSLVHFPISDYVFHQGRGTVKRFGYRLGWRGQWNKIVDHTRRALDKAQNVLKCQLDFIGDNYK